MEWVSFLAELQRVERVNVLPFGSDRGTSTNTVYIGCGSTKAHREVADIGNLILNNKDASVISFAGAAFSSLTRLITYLPDGFLDRWSFEICLGPVEALQKLTLIVDDAGPDSLFSVVVLLARIADVNINSVPKAWIEAVDQWEVTGNAEDPWRSWCPLASALAHSRFPTGSPLTSVHLEIAWTEGLRFLAACLSRKLSPTNIESQYDIVEWRSATAALESENAIYLDWLTHATSIQVSLPIKRSERRLLVDALIFEEDQVTGAAKVLYRNDKERSPLGGGFSLAVHFRSANAGTGNDITIAVDPRRGVHLRELWKELEQRETEAWKDAIQLRPAGSPRKLTGVDCLYDEPWFITPDGTLIGAPRNLPDGRPGSKLAWENVKEAIWQTLNPLKFIKVARADTRQLILLMDLTSEVMRGGLNKRFLAAHWPSGKEIQRDLQNPRALSKAPIIDRFFSALISRQQKGKVGLDDLPNNKVWKRVDLSGGLAIVNSDGLFVLDDWTTEKLDIEPIRRSFTESADLDHRLMLFEDLKLKRLVEGVRRFLERPRFSKEVDQLLRTATALSLDVAEARCTYSLPSIDNNARLVKATLVENWALGERLAAAEGELLAIERSLRSLADTRAAKITRFIATYGFAIFVASGICAPVAKAIRFSYWGGKPDQDAPGALVVACFLLLTVLLSALLWLWQGVEEFRYNRKI